MSLNWGHDRNSTYHAAVLPWNVTKPSLRSGRAAPVDRQQGREVRRCC